MEMQFLEWINIKESKLKRKGAFVEKELKKMKLEKYKDSLNKY